MSTDTPKPEHTEAAALLRAAGYLVVKIPPCSKEGRDHGAHVLITRSARCPGGGNIPHGIHSWYQGSFGPWANCHCGHLFSDYGQAPSDWEKHKQEHIAWFGGSAAASEVDHV